MSADIETLKRVLADERESWDVMMKTPPLGQANPSKPTYRQWKNASARLSDVLREAMPAIFAALERGQRIEEAVIEYQEAYKEAGRLATAVPMDPRGLDENFKRRKAAKEGLRAALESRP